MTVRKRYFRAVLVTLDCGCDQKLSTGRYRVSKDLAGLIASHAVRAGVWCCGGMQQPKEIKGVVRE